MTITFQLNYYAQFGENIVLYYCLDGGSWTQVPMQYTSDNEWQYEQTFSDVYKTLEYYYALCGSDKHELRRESRYYKHLFSCKAGHYRLRNLWLDEGYDVFHTKLFKQVLFAGREPQQSKQVGKATFEIFVPHLLPNQCVGIVGNSLALGSWGTERIQPMSNRSTATAYDPRWTVDLHLPMREDLQYKYVIYDKSSDEIVDLESCENRTIPAFMLVQNCIFSDGFFRYSHPKYHIDGVAVPLFSLRTKTDCGIGEYPDLGALVPWCEARHIQLIQLLPINDTTRTLTDRDSYPYSPNSVHALHPIYLNVPLVGDLGEVMGVKYQKAQRRLQRSETVQYSEVLQTKLTYLEYLFRRDGEALSQTPEYQRFCSQNSTWLPDYALYMSKVLDYPPTFFTFLQYHCHKQLSTTVDTCHKAHIGLKGDITIGVSPTSVEVQLHPELFNTKVSVGAPPDLFTVDGQNWGFPAYDWEAMRSQNYQWWRERLQGMEQYFDAFRIDHILGFFRIWQIPTGASSAREGYYYPSNGYSRSELSEKGIESADEFVKDVQLSDCFYPRIDRPNAPLYNEFYFGDRNDSLWTATGIERLSAVLTATDMLCCGEDLGMIPACVPKVLRQLQILSLEVERAPKTAGLTLTDLTTLPYLCVCTSGTHDMSSLRAWWEERTGVPLPPAQARIEVNRYRQAPTLLTILPFQDWYACDECVGSPASERINDPGNPKQVWNWRIRKPLGVR